MKRASKKTKNIKNIIYFLIIFTLLKVTTQKITDEEVREVCSKADSYVISFFDVDPQIPKKYENFEPFQKNAEENTNILDIIFLKQDAVKKYKENKFRTTNNFVLFIDIILFILTIIIIFIFNVHFFFRAYTFQIIEQKLGNLAIIFKMAPFEWIHYFIYKKEKTDELIKDYNENKISKLTKNDKIVITVISASFLIVLVILSILNNITYNKSEKSSYNVSCAVLKYIYELENKTDKNKNFIGLNKILSFFNYTQENEDILKESYSKNYINSYNKTLSLISKWNNYLTKVDDRLSINGENEFCIESFPSDVICNVSNVTNVTNSHLYQLLTIYNYHPSTDKTKTLYNINNVLQNNYEIFSDMIKKINNTNKYITDEKEIDEELVKKILNKIEMLIEIYVTYFKSEYISSNGNSFIKNNLVKSLMPDMIFLFVSCLCLIASIPVIIYFFGVKYMSDKLFVVIVFYNALFILLLIALINILNVTKLKNGINLINEISEVVAFLLNKDNLHYIQNLKENNENINFRIINENNIEVNILYYINYIINHNGNLNSLYKFKYQNFPISEIEDIYTKLNYITNDKTNIINQLKTNRTSTYITNIINELNTFLKKGVIDTTYFRDLTGPGYRGTGTETPMTYLTFVNILTRAEYRRNFGYPDLLCDETWNVVSINFENYKYKSRAQLIDCNTCVNFINFEGVNPPPLLNFKEYLLEEIIYRYEIYEPFYPSEYYQMLYEFTALHLLIRNNSDPLEHARKLIDINNDIKNMELEIYEALENNTKLGEKIINYYEKMSQDYITSDNFYSFLNFDFIKNDTLFVLAEIQLSFVENMKNYCLRHIITSIICISVIILFILSYSFISYEIPLPKAKNNEIVNIDKIKEEIKIMVKGKMSLKTKSGQKTNKVNVMTDGKNVSIYQTGKTIEKTNVQPVYNTLFCSGNKVINDKDVSNINAKVGPSLLGLNKFFGQNQNNAKNNTSNKLEAIVEEKEDKVVNNNNVCDQSKANIINGDI